MIATAATGTIDNSSSVAASSTKRSSDEGNGYETSIDNDVGFCEYLITATAAAMVVAAAAADEKAAVAAHVTGARASIIARKSISSSKSDSVLSTDGRN